MMTRGRFGWLWPLLSVVVLTVAWAERTTLREAPTSVRDYHLRVRAAIEGFPYGIGDWVATDVPVPRAAVEMLHANSVLSRRFENLSTREHVTLVVVHCIEARDVLGHYPPVCYKGNGWTADSTDQCGLAVGDRSIAATEYVFSRSAGAFSEARINIRNFFLLPNGTISPDMDEVTSMAADYRWKFYGVAQVQIITADTMESERREEVTGMFLDSMHDLFQMIVVVE